MECFESHVLGTVYGNCIGDAVGLLTEFMNKTEAKKYYHKHAEKKGLEYNLKVQDMHRSRWDTGDWTDDSDQMILMIDSILDKNGEVSATDYGEKLMDWLYYGFPELGDQGGLGIGATTYKVFRHPAFTTNPHRAAEDIWEQSGRFLAPNGAVMRTSIMGVYQYKCLDSVWRNTLELCKVTHADPRCQASCIAVTFAIAVMLQRDSNFLEKGGHFDVGKIIDFAYGQACRIFEGLPNEEGYKQELHDNMYVKDLKTLQLDEHDKIGYTYKTLGAGFWALKQNDFRKAITAITMEAGDADTNGAVAGALLGCKLGHTELPETWLYELANKDWLDQRLRKFMTRFFPDVKLKILPDAKKEEHLERHILGTLYGHCIGDAIGLLTEFMTKKEAAKLFPRTNDGGVELHYEQKIDDKHRKMWRSGDWTDDTDQMICIMDSLMARNGDADPRDYGARLKTWARYGFPELGDMGGAGLGNTTHYVLKHEMYDTNPHEAARDIWDRTGREVAPNGAVMRTSVLGIYRYQNIHQVKRNTLRICRVTHADPRCAASCLAVTCAIAYMLHRVPRHYKNGKYNLDQIIQDAYYEACTVFDRDKTGEKYAKELKKYMYTEKLSDLKLDESGKIGYTYKCLGAGFWALRQSNFTKAITAIVMEAGDADTNGAVAGALLGCKLGYSHIAEFSPNWLFQLRYKDWYDQKIRSFLQFAMPELSLSILPEHSDIPMQVPNISNLDPPQQASTSGQKSNNAPGTSRGQEQNLSASSTNTTQGTSVDARQQIPSTGDMDTTENMASVHKHSEKSAEGQSQHIPKDRSDQKNPKSKAATNEPVNWESVNKHM